MIIHTMAVYIHNDKAANCFKAVQSGFKCQGPLTHSVLHARPWRGIKSIDLAGATTPVRTALRTTYN